MLATLIKRVVFLLVFCYKQIGFLVRRGIQLTKLESLKSKVVTELLNGTILTIQSIVPIEYKIIKPRLIYEAIQLQYGVIIGITGDVQVKLMITGSSQMFSQISEKMYGMPLEGDMLISFSGEFGNMIAGGLSTNIAAKGTIVNITSPTIMNETTTVDGYNRMIELPIVFKEIGKMHTYLLIN